MPSFNIATGVPMWQIRNLVRYHQEQLHRAEVENYDTRPFKNILKSIRETYGSFAPIFEEVNNK